MKLKNEKAKKLGTSWKTEVKLSSRQKKANRIFPKRLILGPPDFDKLPYARLQEIQALKKEAKLIFDWVDGKRSLWEIYQGRQAMLDEELHFKDFMAAFKFLKKYRYIRTKSI